LETKSKTSGVAVAVLAVLLVVFGAVALYSNYQLNQANATRSSAVSNLQNLINQLQAENSQLKNQLASGVQTQGNSSLLGLDPVSIYRTVNRSVVTVEGDRVTTVNTFFGPQQSVQSIIGSGFVTKYLGAFYVITNFHVVDGVKNLTVTFANGDSFGAQAVGTDPYSDLGVVTANAPSSELFPVQIAPSSSLNVGAPVVVIGNPFGLSGSMTLGIVSQLGRTIQEATAGNFLIADAIQFSAQINPGNSGGPLLNSNGMVVGITTAAVSGSQGVGFAIPSDTILRELSFLISTGSYTRHPYVGIGTADMNYQLAKIMGTNVTYGALVEQVSQGSPASRAGLRAGDRTVSVRGTQYSVGGDIIISVNGSRIINTDAFSSYLEEHAQSGQTVHLGIIRSGVFMTVDVVLGTRPSP
jgi:S1-C subfamily serine protease